MPGLTDRRVILAAAFALPVVVGATVFTLAPDASAAPGPAAASDAPVTLKARTTTLPFKKVTARAGTARRADAAPVDPLPVWSSTFRYASAHKTYPFTMIGSDPSLDGVTTSVANTLTAVSFRFPDKHVEAPNPALVRQLQTTGLYASQPFPGGRGQYGDVYLRTQFWTALQNGTKTWHVLMNTPVRKGVLSLSVPAGKGGKVKLRSGKYLYLVDLAWFDDQVQSRVTAAQTKELTQFLGGNLVLCGHFSNHDISSCGIGGYHSGLDAPDGPHTYLYASYLDPAFFGAASGFYKLSPLSHELAEWLTDPMLTNVVPKWTQPSVPQYGCSSLMEVGDPLVGRNVTVGSQVYQDEAYVPFFSRVKTSTSWNQRFSWFGNLKGGSRGC